MQIVEASLLTSKSLFLKELRPAVSGPYLCFSLLLFYLILRNNMPSLVRNLAFGISGLEKNSTAGDLTASRQPSPFKSLETLAKM